MGSLRSAHVLSEFSMLFRNNISSRFGVKLIDLMVSPMGHFESWAC